MKQITQVFERKRDCKHSIVFEPVAGSIPTPAFAGSTIASSVYINRSVLPAGTTSVKLTLSIADGGSDDAYNAVK